MDVIPGRPAVASPYRAVLTALGQRLILPKVNPVYYHLLAIFLSVLFLYAQESWIQIAIVGAVLMTDWLDGATAKRYWQPSRAGYVIDVVTDRASEGFLFAGASGMLSGQVLFLLWLINCGLTFYSVRSNRHTAMPLRFAYLIILAVQGV